jgi:hypothetical protein
MTPQEKAKELIRKYYSIGAIECKNCALIAVQEMIELLDELPMDEEVIEQFAYLQQVKLELKNYIPTNNA